MALRPGRSRAPATPSLPHPSVQWLRRRGRQPARGGRSAAKHTPAGAEHRPSPPAGRGTAPRASPPTPAPPATTAPSPPPPLALRAGHRAVEAPPPGAPQTKPSRGCTWGEEEVAARPRPTLRQPRPTCSSLPLGIHFPEKPVSPRAALPQAPSTMSRSSPPGPGGPRSLPPRGAGAEESCPTGSAGGERVLAAPCVRREWSCCKMAAEAHAAGSKPDPVPLASERAPGARAPPRDPPSLPSLARPLLSLTPSAQPLPSDSSSFSPRHLRRPLAALSSQPSSFLPCTSSPSFPTPVRGRSHTSGRPSSSLALSGFTPSLASSLSAPSPVPAESLFLSPALT